MTSKVVKTLIGLAALGVGAKIVFGATMIFSIQNFLAQDALQSPPKKSTPYIAGNVPELPEVIHSSELPDPFVRSARAMHALKLKGLLSGAATDGWSLRYNTKDDLAALRPDLANCLIGPQPDCYMISKRHEAEVLVKGDKRIYIHFRISAPDIFDDIQKDVQASLRNQYPNKRWVATRPDFANVEYLSNEWTDLPDWNGLRMKRLENKGGKGASFIEAEMKNNGRITLAILTNAPLEDVHSRLAAMDLGMLRALVSPFPFGGFDTLEEYIEDDFDTRAKKEKFVVLTQEELLRKAAEMGTNKSIRYLRDMLSHAVREGNELSDYDILYHPLGDAGERDTRAYLAGEITEDDPRYEVLHEEHRYHFPIGSCLQIRLGMACRAEAEQLRITALLRAQAALKSDAAGTAYSEEAFQQDMREIELQMETALQKLVQLQAAD